MKRAQMSSPDQVQSTSQPASKRQKVDMDANGSNTQDDEGWTKVEKRKAKKQKKQAEGKLGVRMPQLSSV